MRPTIRPVKNQPRTCSGCEAPDVDTTTVYVRDKVTRAAASVMRSHYCAGCLMILDSGMSDAERFAPRSAVSEIDTGPYRFAHGRTPRGRGSWAFTFKTTGRRIILADWFVDGSWLFTDAVRFARLHAAALATNADFSGSIIIEVCT